MRVCVTVMTAKMEEKTTSELKERLWKIVKTIVDSDDYTLQNADDAIAALSSLKDFKSRSVSNRTNSFDDKLDEFAPPTEFRCPISTQLMIDPVILSTGQVQFNSFIFPLFLIYLILLNFLLLLLLLYINL